LPRERGVVLADVIPGSPADHAGLRAGDIVLSLDGKPLDNGRQLQVGLYRDVVGAVVTLEILRDGRVDRFRLRLLNGATCLACRRPWTHASTWLHASASSD
jgi:S1-C subfamily serine protease